MAARVLLTGASGFVGSALSVFLQKRGYEVVHLKRGKGLSSFHTLIWNPDQPLDDLSAFEGFEAVIHLAGEGIASHKWTPEYKKRIYSSRIDYTKAFVKVLSKLKSPPRVFVSASAVGYYGDCGDEIITESSPAGEGFLAKLAKDWELASFPLKALGVRLIHARFGIVLDPKGGMLKKMLLPYKLGLGANLGSGEQFISWIALSELLRVIAFCLSTPHLQGAINAVSPEPICQKDFSHLLAQTLHRPAFLTLPAPILRFFFKEMADELLLSSQRCIPEKLLKAGFVFQSSSLTDSFISMRLS